MKRRGFPLALTWLALGGCSLSFDSPQYIYTETGVADARVADTGVADAGADSAADSGEPMPNGCGPDCAPCDGGVCGGGSCLADGVLFRDDFESGAIGSAWTSIDPQPWTVSRNDPTRGGFGAVAGQARRTSKSELTLSLARVPASAQLRFMVLPLNIAFATFRLSINGLPVQDFEEGETWVEFTSPPLDHKPATFVWSYWPNSDFEFDRPRIDDVEVRLVCPR